MTDSVSAHYLGVRGKIPQEHLDMLGRAWWTILEQCRREEIGNEVLPPLENSNVLGNPPQSEGLEHTRRRVLLRLGRLEICLKHR